MRARSLDGRLRAGGEAAGHQADALVSGGSSQGGSAGSNPVGATIQHQYHTASDLDEGRSGAVLRVRRRPVRSGCGRASVPHLCPHPSRRPELVVSDGGLTVGRIAVGGGVYSVGRLRSACLADVGAPLQAVREQSPLFMGRTASRCTIAALGALRWNRSFPTDVVMVVDVLWPASVPLSGHYHLPARRGLPMPGICPMTSSSGPGPWLVAGMGDSIGYPGWPPRFRRLVLSDD
jgi:hypothetical protein